MSPPVKATVVLGGSAILGALTASPSIGLITLLLGLMVAFKLRPGEG